MPKHMKFLSVTMFLIISCMSGVMLNDCVYSRDNDFKGEEFINVTVYERINPAIVLVEAQMLDGLSKLGDSSMVKVGQKVLAIGNPFGFNGTLTTGIVSRIDYERNKIQTDAAINPGSSGGPILNANGEVIGISQSIFNPDNNKSNIGIGFAVPANEVKKLVSAYI